MNDKQISPVFYLALVKFLLHGKQEVVRSSADLGLSSMQALTLLLTDNNEPRSMNSFCNLYSCDASNITGIVDGLEQKGLVSRQEHPHDRRVKIIRLEPAGEKVKTKVLRKLAASNELLFAPLSASETKQLITIIQKLDTSNSLVAAKE